MTIAINTSALVGYYNSKAGITTGATTSAASASSSAAATAPVAPWTQTPTATQISASVQSALNGASIINPSTKTTGTTPNYNNLFALYQGLSTLTDLANQASTSGETSGQIAQLQKAFSSGLAQVQTFLSTDPFTGFQVVAGEDTAQQKSTIGIASETDTYKTGVIYSGDQNSPVPSLEGDISFSATVAEPYGSTQTVNFNLDDMGSTPRTIGNVVNYLNSQLKAAGLQSTFSVVNTPGKPQTVALANGQSVTLPAGPDQFSLKLNGNSLETFSFSAPTTAPAVYVAQTAGVASTSTTTSATSKSTSTSSTSSSTSSTASGAVQQLIKLNPNASTSNVFTDALGNQVTNVTATATAPDGSVYVLGDVNGPTPAGETSRSQAIAGSQDVALLKYDSAGNLLSTSILGAASSASGLSLAVSADGSQVAVAGTVTGALAGTTTPSNATTPQSFVSVYGSNGSPVWTARQNTTYGDQANSVAFGAKGAVYVGGTVTTSASGGQTAAYLSGYDATGAQTFTTQFANGTGQNGVAGVAVDGSNIITAGVENGSAVVRSFAIPASGAPTLAATQNLGALQGGSVAGVAVNADGSIIVAGSTHNGALNAGTVTTAYTSGGEAFVAQIANANLTPSASNTLTYYKGASNTTASAVTVSGGQVYIAGQVSATPTAGETTAYDGYVAQIDPTTGAVGWSSQITTYNNESAPHAIAVNQTGSSVLDALGLPSGTINYTPNQALAANGDVKAGDSFTVTSYGVSHTITISSTDTLKTLAEKIQSASTYQATATVTTIGGSETLQISPANSQSQITLGAGPSGQDALAGLGLSPGLITNTTVIKSKTSTVKTSYGLNLPSNLNLSTTAGIANAKAALTAATGAVATIYNNLTTPPASTSGASASSSGKVPAYLSAELANYQAGLSRLTGGSSSSSSSTSSSSLGSSLATLLGG